MNPSLQTASGRTVLQVEGLSYQRDRPILTDVSWRVVQGEHWVILGANGCGKTSLISCVTGYEMATAGEIVVDESTYGQTDWREVRKRVGLVTSTLTQYLEPYEPVLDVVVSGREAMLNLVGEPNQLWRAEARELLERVGCAYLAGSRWGVLSQGERQKILICRAFMARHAVLILDEPCAGLDPVARERFLQWLASVAEQASAPALVLVTHHVEEILPCFTHVLLLKAGQVLAQGVKAEVLTSEALSEAYGASVSLKYDEGAARFNLEITKPIH
jgi:iron complex transport system ATP-binding protein